MNHGPGTIGGTKGELSWNKAEYTKNKESNKPKMSNEDKRQSSNKKGWSANKIELWINENKKKQKTETYHEETLESTVEDTGWHQRKNTEEDGLKTKSDTLWWAAHDYRGEGAQSQKVCMCTRIALKPTIFSGLNNTICKDKLTNKVLIES